MSIPTQQTKRVAPFNTSCRNCGARLAGQTVMCWYSKSHGARCLECGPVQDDSARPAASSPEVAAPAAVEVVHAKSAIEAAISSIHESLAREAVSAEIVRRSDDIRPQVHVHFGNAKTVTLPDCSHSALPEVLELLNAKLPVLLVGPSGSGKTELARQAAEVLGRPFTFNSLSAGVTESAIFGRVMPDAQGVWSYQDSPFVRSFRDGGVHLFDEMDAADPNMLVSINAALSNGHIAVPQARVEPFEKHELFGFLGATNTWGRGADREYVGRNALDAATRNRFSVSTVFVDYDTALERRVATDILGEADSLLAWAHDVRAKIMSAKLRQIMSSRTIFDAAKLMSAGRSLDKIKASYFMSWTADERAKVGA